MDGAPLELIDLDETWGDQPFGAPMPRAFRLSDAERIAAQRLEGAAEGSLKEALATMIVEMPDESARVDDRLHTIAAELPAAGPELALGAGLPPAQAAETTPFEPVAALPRDVDFGWFGAVPPAHAVPCFEDRDLDMEFMAAFAPIPAAAPAPMSIPDLLMSEPAVQIAAEAPPVAATEAPAVSASALETPAADAPLSPPPRPPLVALPEDPNLEPIVTAYAASAKLAADAAAASQALFELQRLLNQQRLEASPELNVAMEAHGLAGLDAIPVAQQPAAASPPVTSPARAPDPATDESLVPPRVVQQAHVAPAKASSVPPPLPPAARPPEMPIAAAPRLTAAMPSEPRRAMPPESKLRTAPSRLQHAQPAPARTEPRRVPTARAARPTRRASSFDVRGFAAGFALSGAIGVVLYLVMATS